uniref:Calponin-homology (CH) domain-containing protein n=1 Tax=Glossina morsitans morsitans TaxID=37546 RepID=A0A1B0G258_GLOMM
MEAERDLAEDAQWKKIQQNTFTRWANEHLKTIDRSINNLETDLSDGLRLIALIEVLSQKRMPKFNKRPTFRSQKLENVSVALKFLEDEGIKIVNIGRKCSAGAACLGVPETVRLSLQSSGTCGFFYSATKYGDIVQTLNSPRPRHAFPNMVNDGCSYIP